MKEKIIKIIDEEIALLINNQNIIDINSIQKELTEYQQKISTIKSINIPIEAISVNKSIEKIKDFLGNTINISESDIIALCFYIDAKKDFGLDKKQEEDLNRIIELIINEINININSLINKIETYNSIKSNIDELEMLKYNLEQNNLSENEIVTITNLFKKILNGKKANESVDIIKLYIDFMQSRLPKVTELEPNEEEFFEEIIETNISEDDIKNILNNYQIDFDKFSKKAKDKLIKYGNLDNMNKILKTLKNNIGIDSERITELSEKFVDILNFSTADIIIEAINNFKKDGDNINQTTDFYELYLKNSRYLIKGNKECNKKTSKNQSSSTNPRRNPNKIYGANDNYRRNRQLLLQNGITDINKQIKKCSSFFLLSPDRTIKRLDSLSEFGFDKKEALRNLSIFENSNMFKTLDLFIEFGMLNYARQYSSILINTPKQNLFLRMALAKKMGIPLLLKNNVFNSIVRVGTTDANSPFHRGTTKEETETDRKRLSNLIEISTPKYSNPNFPTKECDEIIKNNDWPTITVDEKFKDIHSNVIEYIRNFDELTYFGKAIKQNEFEYHIDDIVISRKKVLRNYFLLIKNNIKFDKDLLLYSICNGSILTEEQIKKIKHAVNMMDSTYEDTLEERKSK